MSSEQKPQSDHQPSGVASSALLACRCGAKSSQVIRAIGVNYWTCYCNSCGRNDAEGYGPTRDEAIADYNRKQANARDNRKPVRAFQLIEKLGILEVI